MIDLNRENVISLREATKLVPPMRRNRPVNLSTVWRWALRGSRGVKLETLRLPGGLVTSREALQRFAVRLSGGEPTAETPSPGADPARKARRRAEIQAAEARLRARGISV